MSIFLLVTAILFILIDVLMGLRRGLFPALVRFGFVFVCVMCSVFFAAPLSHYLLGLKFIDGQSLQEVFEAYLYAQNGVAEALALSDPIEQIVLHLPEVLLSEIAFVLMFFLARLVTLPISALVCRIAFGPRHPKPAPVDEIRKEKKPLVGTIRWAGMLVGLVQAVICFAVLLVPLFGTVEFCERFEENFSDAEEVALADISSDLREKIIEPVNDSDVTHVAEALGIRATCVYVFHRLSDTTIVLSTGERTIDYFEYLESMFPAVSALLKLVDVDPEHMTDEDYDNLCIVLETAQSHEDIVVAVKDSVTEVVSTYVDDSFRSSADVVVATFTDKILSEEGNLDSQKLKAEVASVQDTLKVIQTATSASADSAFEVIAADTLVDGIIKTEVLYDTLVEVANDPERCAVLQTDFASSDEQKARMKDEIEKYRQQSLETRSAEEMAKIAEITDALALVLNVEIADLPGFVPAA